MTNAPVPTLAAFISNLHSERDAMRAFVSLLENEQNNLLGAQTDQLLELADGKTRIVNQLTELGSARRQYQATHGEGEETGNMEVWLKARAANELPVWEEIRKLATRAQQLNHTNGEMIRVKLRHNQQALTVLHNAVQNASLYGPDGQPTNPGKGRTLGSV